MHNHKVKSTVIAITMITVLCKIMGFVKNSVLAYYYGTSTVVDAYVMTFSIGSITCGWIAGLVGNFTPVYNKVEANDGRRAAIDFAGNIYNFIILLVVILIILLELFAPIVVQLVAPGFDSATHDYTVYFFRLYLISVLFYSVFRFSQEFLNCNREHLKAVAPDVLMSTCCIISIVVSSTIGDSFLIYGYVIAVILQSIIVTIGCYGIGFRHRLSLNFNDNLKSLIIMAIPIFLSNTLTEINTLVDKIFASNLESGIVSSLDYANTMKDFAFQIGTIALITMIFPILSKLWANKNIKEFKETLLKGINYMTILYIPIIIGIVLLGDLAINIVFKRGQFDAQAAEITTNAFIIYSLSLIAMVYRSLFLKAFYSMQKTKYILLVSFVNVGLNILLNFILVKNYGYIGLATATSLASLLCLPLYFVLFKKSIGDVSYRACFINLIKSLFSGGVMLVVLMIVKKAFISAVEGELVKQIGLLCAMVVIGAFLYCLIGYLLKIDELTQMAHRLKSKIIRR